MKKIYLLPLFMIGLIGFSNLQAQCVPDDCSATVGPLGGLCQDALPDGLVDDPYSESLSFYASNACIDAGAIDPQFAGTYIKITELKYFEFDFLPDGIVGATNNLIYTAPTSGCAGFSGTPTEVGTFEIEVNFMINITAYGDPACFFALGSFDSIEIPAPLELIIKPDPSFSGLASNYCQADADVSLTIDGTAGGTFVGPGVSGNTFSPNQAGAGTHTIKYIVSAQEGAAIAPATDSSEVVVTVEAALTYYEDADGDGFGNQDVSVQSCTPVSGYVTNAEDCDDTDPSVGNEDFAVYYADLDEDGYHNPLDSVATCVQPSGYILLSESLGEDCDDTNPNINPSATEIPNNGIDENCSGADSVTVSISNLINQDFNVYPNPGNDYINIELSEQISNDLKIDAISMDGRKFNLPYTSNNSDKKAQINTSKLSSGIYLITLRNSEGYSTFKWVKN
jgi:hypothetical protein